MNDPWNPSSDARHQFIADRVAASGNVIDSQLNVITNAIEWTDDIYDNMQTDKIKVISAALNIIHKAQWMLIKEIQGNYRPGTAREP